MTAPELEDMPELRHVASHDLLELRRRVQELYNEHQRRPNRGMTRAETAIYGRAASKVGSAGGDYWQRALAGREAVTAATGHVVLGDKNGFKGPAVCHAHPDCKAHPAVGAACANESGFGKRGGPCWLYPRLTRMQLDALIYAEGDKQGRNVSRFGAGWKEIEDEIRARENVPLTPPFGMNPMLPGKTIVYFNGVKIGRGTFRSVPTP